MPIYKHKNYVPHSLLFYKISQPCNKEKKSQDIRKGKEKTTLRKDKERTKTGHRLRFWKYLQFKILLTYLEL